MLKFSQLLSVVDAGHLVMTAVLCPREWHWSELRSTYGEVSVCYCSKSVKSNLRRLIFVRPS